MPEQTQDRITEMIADNERLDAAHARAAWDALLEHARMGRSVCESRGGEVVWSRRKESSPATDSTRTAIR